ncbi:aldehyde dehydrogenase family protein [Leucothrix arctica]|uniref:Aldehyde dehydrogenase n=1 Tax=Leucothrix arctica TaxID=1481894 RepID=A0A317C7Q6_9GAMM|nr:aldehyde dehydrogenase family protein [Leucothrix arctica]PWQ93403.1 aldehyde dehydrogenase [Leucothrix arctica]
MSKSTFECISPIDDTVVYTGQYSATTDVDKALSLALDGQKQWRALSLSERIATLKIAVEYLHDNREPLGLEITQQMGRPIRYTAGELAGLKERADMMFELAPEALKDHVPPLKDGFERRISREPLGIVAVLAPWNYPYLTSVNAIIPALIAGNAVILKPASQTPMTALRYSEAFEKAGLPEGVFQHLFLTHDTTATLIGDPRVDYVAFTGSVGGGHAVSKAIAHKFIGAGLELGGKDPAYVRADTDTVEAAVSLADGAFFNSGQSCCGIERIYVDESQFDIFVDTVITEAKVLTLGNPTDTDISMGPMATARGADGVRTQIKTAINAGATAHLPVDENWGSPYLKPQVLTNVSHDMAIMHDETFGPVVGIMAVSGDDEAITLMNDSEFGLTASIWTQDTDAARTIGQQLETGTVFMNRCDYLDPALAWTGVKNSGRGATLSSLGFEHLTRPKSYHFKLPVSG